MRITVSKASKTAVCVFAAAACCVGQARLTPDPEIAAAVNSIKAIDAHTHPEQILEEGKTDTQWDGFPDDAYAAPRVPYIPAKTRPRNANIVASWRALWGIPDQTWSEDAVKRALASKSRIKKEKGDDYPAWVLDQAGIDIALSNRVTMQRWLLGPRFKWVSYADAYMFSLSTARVQASPPLYPKFYGGLEQQGKALRGGKPAPSTVSAWVNEYVRPPLEKQKREGVVAIRYTSADYRAIDFVPVPAQEANAIYSRYVGDGSPAYDEYKKL